MLSNLSLGALLAMSVAHGAFADTPANTLVIADALDDIKTLDPGEVSEVAGVMITQQIYEPLVSFDLEDPTRIIGVLAESWEVAEDGTTFTFKMNPDAAFQSGNNVTAHDAEFSLRRVVQMEAPSSFILTQFGWTKDNVEEMVQAIDDETLVIKTAEAYAPSFLYYCLSSFSGGIVDSVLVKEHEVDGDYGNAWLKQGNSAGSGAFALQTWEPKQAVILSRNDAFWGEVPAMERLFFQHVPESATQRLLLEKGDIDIANKLGPDDFDAIAGNDDVSIMTGVSGTIYYFGLNVRNENLANPKVVEAMKYLVDYEGIADSIGRGTIEVHQTMVPRGFLGAVDYNPYSLDIEKAKGLLEEAGVGPFELETVVWNNPPYTEFAQAVQATMAQAGIDLKLEVVDGGQWLDRYRSHDLDVWVGLWGPDYPDPHSNSKAFSVNSDDTPDGSESLADRFGWDAGDLSPRTMDALRETDTDTRRAMYEEIQREHTDSSPFLYMFQQNRKVAMRSDVEGLVLGITFADDRYEGVTKD